MITRILSDTLLKRLKIFPAVAILGPRQSGKTTLAKILAARLSKKSIWLDMELPGDAARMRNPELFFEDNEDVCVIIDEVQREPGLFPVMRAMIDRNRRPGRFIVLGSASPDLLRQSSESLAGRIFYSELTPFCLPEIERKYPLKKHWLRGGFPAALLARSDAHASHWLTSFIRTYMERELPMLGIPGTPQNLTRLFSMLAHQQGSIFNASEFSKSLGLSSPTVSSYAEFLENAFLIRRLQPFFHNAKKRIVKSPKVYVRDSGILHNLNGINSFNALLGHPLLGRSWEGYVVEQVAAATQNIPQYYFYRTQDGTECDLVLAKNDKPLIAIECKVSPPNGITKGLLNSIADLNTKHNFIVSVKCPVPYKIHKNITVCDLGTGLNEIGKYF